MLTAEQLEVRKHGLGSSDIAAVCGLNPWRGPLDVWMEKTGRAEARPDTPQTRLGNRLERQIAELYAEERGCDLTPGQTVIGAEPWIIATPDFYVGLGGERRILECKNVGHRIAHHWPEGEIPDYVLAQGLWQMEATGIRGLDVAALVGGRDFRIVPVAYNAEVVASILEIGEEFWTQYVLADVEPPVDGSDSWAEYIKRKWPTDLAPPLEATPDDEELGSQLALVRARMKNLEVDRAELENALKARIGDAAGIRAHEWSVSWKCNASGGTDYKGLSEFLGATPDQIAAFARPGARVFRFTSKGK